MTINLTLLGQIITFMVFIWVTMKYVWPPIMKAVHERQQKIADGLAASDKGKKELELAQHRAIKILQDAKLEASQLVEQANKRAVEIVEEAKEQARHEAEQIIKHGHTEVEQMEHQAREALRQDVSTLVVQGAERILQREVDQKAHETMLKELAEAL